MLKIGNSEKWIVGVDLGRENVQISYCATKDDRKVETISAVAGQEDFCIPMVLCKRPGVNQWFYGKEAIRYAQEQDGILVEHLLQLALDGEPVHVEETEFDPAALLALFLKRCLGLLPGGGADDITAILFTCDEMTNRMEKALEKVVSAMRLKTDRITFQSHEESYFYYCLKQAEELWRQPSALFEYAGNSMNFYHMECNRKTQPMVVLVHQERVEFPSRESLGEGEEADQELDRKFAALAEKLIGEENLASVYLIGEDFSERWLKQSLRFLCGGRRRIFLGNNLFCKGACYGAISQFYEEQTKYAFLGVDKLKNNIGMLTKVRGEEKYLALLDAGRNWRKAVADLEFYLHENEEITLQITSLTGGGKRLVSIPIEELKGNVARVRMILSLKRDDLLVAEVEDLGFGEFRHGENKIWTQEIPLF